MNNLKIAEYILLAITALIATSIAIIKSIIGIGKLQPEPAAA